MLALNYDIFARIFNLMYNITNKKNATFASPTLTTYRRSIQNFTNQDLSNSENLKDLKIIKMNYQAKLIIQ